MSQIKYLNGTTINFYSTELVGKSTFNYTIQDYIFTAVFELSETYEVYSEKQFYSAPKRRFLSTNGDSSSAFYKFMFVLSQVGGMLFLVRETLQYIFYFYTMKKYKVSVVKRIEQMQGKINTSIARKRQLRQYENFDIPQVKIEEEKKSREENDKTNKKKKRNNSRK